MRNSGGGFAANMYGAMPEILRNNRFPSLAFEMTIRERLTSNVF